jgi:carbonic anhydrase/acetyltransferase-like protein (isoleucine patch superfamily)
MLGLILIAALPTALKRPLYRLCFGYRIGRGARIGLAYLDCAQLVVGDETRISHGVVLWGCGEVLIGRRVSIGPLNVLRGGERIELEDYAQIIRLNFINAIREPDCETPPDSTFHLGYASVVTAEHRVDFTDRVSIGKCSILGGRNSSIWTHNRRAGLAVEIGDFCYVGSEIRMAPGARVPDCSVVGLGSVITRPLAESYTLIAGVPARSRRPLRDDDYELIFGKTRPEIPDEDYPPPPPRPTLDLVKE